MKYRLPIREELLGPLLVGVALLAAIWTFSWMVSQREAAESATEDLQVCRRLAKQIQQLQTSPRQAGDAVRSASALAGEIESAAQVAQLPASQIVQIDPQPPRRIGNTPYNEQPTRIELRDVTLQQLLSFLTTLLECQTSADVAEIRLSAPREEQTNNRTQERWSAEMIIADRLLVP